MGRSRHLDRGRVREWWLGRVEVGGWCADMQVVTEVAGRDEGREESRDAATEGGPLGC